MPDYPAIPAGKAVPLIDTATNLPDSAAVLAALDDRYLPDDTGWIALTNASGATALDGINSAYRIKGGDVLIRVSASVSIPAGDLVIATGLPSAAQPATTTGIVRFALGFGVGGAPGIGHVYPAGHASAGQVFVTNQTGATRTWASGFGRYTKD